MFDIKQKKFDRLMPSWLFSYRNRGHFQYSLIHHDSSNIVPRNIPESTLNVTVIFMCLDRNILKVHKLS